MKTQLLPPKKNHRAYRDVHLEDQARAELDSLPYGALRRTSCRMQENRLVLSGTVPSFHLKQLAQEHLRKCMGPEVLISNELLVHAKRKESH